MKHTLNVECSDDEVKLHLDQQPSMDIPIEEFQKSSEKGMDVTFMVDRLGLGPGDWMRMSRMVNKTFGLTRLSSKQYMDNNYEIVFRKLADAMEHMIETIDNLVDNWQKVRNQAVIEARNRLND